MKILGLDCATHTGYCILNDGNLETYGVIDIPQEMNILQRLSFFENNILKILEDYKPDYVAIEDIIMGISGVKVLAYLSRLSGVALSACYKKVNNNIFLYTPSEWKSKSFDGLNGTAKKYEIQISVCKHFKLINDDLLAQITKPLSNIKDNTVQLQDQLNSLTLDTKKYIAYLNRKRHGCQNDSERNAFRKKIDDNKKIILQYKKSIDDNRKKIEDIYKNVSLEIMSNCGLTCDVADSCGIAYCLYKNLMKT